MTDTLSQAGDRVALARTRIEPSDDRGTRAAGSEFVQDLGEAARDNPLSAALITMGVVWLFAGGGGTSLFGRRADHEAAFGGRSRGLGRVEPRRPYGANRAGARAASGAAAAGHAVSGFAGQVGEGASRAGTAIGAAASAATSHISDAVSSAYEGMGSVAERTADMASGAGASLYESGRAVQRSGLDLARTAQQDLGEMFERQPLLLGAIGLAIGAGVAASLPTTKAESRLIGETSDSVKEQARGLVSDQLDKASKMAERAFQEVRREAEAQGLSEAGVAEAIRQFGEKLTNVAATARAGIGSELGAAGQETKGGKPG